MSYYEPSWDEDGNPEVGTWVREEPDNDCCNTVGDCVCEPSLDESPSVALPVAADVMDRDPTDGPSGAGTGAPF